MADDWLISPAITPTATGKLMVQYTTYGTSYGEKLAVYTGNAPTVEAMTKLQAQNDKVLGVRTTEYFFYDATAGVPFHVGFHTTSPADQWRFYMCEFSVKQVDKVVDLQVDNVLSPVSGDNLSNAETVKVHVVNNGLDASDKFEVAYQLDGGAVVKEKVDRSLAPGEAMEYTFSQKADLSTPRHKYALKAYTIEPNDINTDNDTTAVVVRHGGAVTPPYSWGFEPGDDTADFKFYNLNGDDGEWKVYQATYMNMARTGYGCLAYNYNKENDADDWAMLDPIKVEAGNYVLRYWYSGSDGHTEKLGVYWGTGNTPDDMDVCIDEQTIKQGKYQEAFKVIKFDKPQTIYLGFYSHSDKDENWLTIESDDDNMPDNNVMSKEVNVLGAPVVYYDFEDGKISSDLSFYVGDSGTVNANAGEEFNKEGWGIFNIEKHAMLGEHVLAGTSWIDGATPDRWLILPKVHVNSENACFVWDAMSFNQLLLETYRVKVSDGSGNPADYWYTTDLEVKGETITPKTRGISLSKYNGKDVYIAFNLVTPKGEVLCLDNIGVYGDVVNGITDVNGEAAGMFIVDDNSFGAVGAKSVAVVDLSGRTVLRAESSSTSVAGLQPGVYVGVAKFADGNTKSLKFVKK